MVVYLVVFGVNGEGYKVKHIAQTADKAKYLAKSLAEEYNKDGSDFKKVGDSWCDCCDYIEIIPMEVI